MTSFRFPEKVFVL